MSKLENITKKKNTASVANSVAALQFSCDSSYPLRCQPSTFVFFFFLFEETYKNIYDNNIASVLIMIFCEKDSFKDVIVTIFTKIH